MSRDESTISSEADPVVRVDPGSSRFYLSLEDDLMRIFGGERVKVIMERVGMADGEPIEHKYTTRAIENAQKKVEGHNFDIRKHLIEYDDVMNKQREVVYSQRRFILGGQDLKESVQDMAEDMVKSWWKLHGRANRLHRMGHRGLGEALWGSSGYASNSMRCLMLKKPSKVSREFLFEECKKAYEAKEAEITPEIMRELEKFIMIQAVDNQWEDYLLSMDYLKEGIHLRGYGQRVP